MFVINLPGDAALAICETDACLVTPFCTTTVCSSPVKVKATGSWVIDLFAIFYYKYVNAPWDVAVPYVDKTATSTTPVTAYAGLVAVICPGVSIENDVDTPPNFTVATVVKFAPVIITDVPPACGPDDGATV